jgi:hypothetical protein
MLSVMQGQCRGEESGLHSLNLHLTKVRSSCDMGVIVYKPHITLKCDLAFYAVSVTHQAALRQPSCDVGHQIHSVSLILGLCCV